MLSDDDFLLFYLKKKNGNRRISQGLNNYLFKECAVLTGKVGSTLFVCIISYSRFRF